MYQLSRRFSFALLLLFPFALRGQEAAMPAGTELPRIMNKPGVIRTYVSNEEGEGQSKWIGMLADIHICVDIPQETLRKIVTDYERYPQVFKRMRSIQVRRENEGAYQDWHIGVGFKSFSFDTYYTLLAVEKENTPERYLLDFTHVADDGSIKDAWGQWYFESVRLEGREWTYIRYTTSSRVLRKFPLQKTVMGWIINMEYTDLMNQFVKAARSAYAKS
ncbi:MAG: SRPBCC family protein [Treponema sp.]|jgi:ribosome-associated toxin RatA of RatAB toxin-antitoxin module|nr:SRPBCC family protein [Treponema sp.]